MRRVRVGVAQVRATTDLDSALATVREIASQASSDGVQLLVFPEATLGGYPRGASFGTVVGNRSDEGRDEFLAYASRSVAVPGAEVDELASIASEHRLHLVVGVIERVVSTLHCAVVMFDDSGRLISVRRKLMPTGAERLVWGQGDGSTLRVVPTTVGRLATAICWENLMPALRLNYYAQGPEVWCAPTADARDVQLATMRHIAVEGRCFVLAANQFAQARDLAPEYVTTYTDPDEVVCRGASVIVDPFGTVLAGPLLTGSGLLCADIDLDDVVRGRLDFDAAGHYARPDIFTLVVDDRPKPSVSWMSQDAGSTP
ncbi:MAG: nitrilase-related carbon-nitrogen hydrolase [Ilumatobacteraceae bacterium]